MADDEFRMSIDARKTLSLSEVEALIQKRNLFVGSIRDFRREMAKTHGTAIKELPEKYKGRKLQSELKKAEREFTEKFQELHNRINSFVLETESIVSNYEATMAESLRLGKEAYKNIPRRDILPEAEKRILSDATRKLETCKSSYPYRLGIQDPNAEERYKNFAARVDEISGLEDAAYWEGRKRKCEQINKMVDEAIRGVVRQNVAASWHKALDKNIKDSRKWEALFSETHPKIAAEWAAKRIEWESFRRRSSKTVQEGLKKVEEIEGIRKNCGCAGAITFDNYDRYIKEANEIDKVRRKLEKEVREKGVKKKKIKIDSVPLIFYLARKWSETQSDEESLCGELLVTVKFPAAKEEEGYPSWSENQIKAWVQKKERQFWQKYGSTTPDIFVGVSTSDELCGSGIDWSAEESFTFDKEMEDLGFKKSKSGNFYIAKVSVPRRKGVTKRKPSKKGKKRPKKISKRILRRPRKKKSKRKAPSKRKKGKKR